MFALSFNKVNTLNMQIKNFLSLALLLAGNILLAGIPYYNNPGIKSCQDESCVLPPPTNFHVVELEPAAVTYGWDGPLLPRVHRIRVFRSSDGLLLSTTDVPAGLNEVTIAVPVATPVDAEICTICANGEEGPSSPRLHTDGIIMDIIVKGFTPNLYSKSCWLNSTNPICCFSIPGVTTFLARKSTPPFEQREFTIEKSPYTNRFILKTDTNASDDFFRIQLDGHNPDWYNGSEYDLKLRVGELPVAKFTVSYPGGNIALLRLRSILPGYEIVRYTPCNYGRPEDTDSGLEERKEDSSNGNSSAIIVRNPFSESLDILLSPSNAELVKFELYNLNGQKVLDRQFPGGQAQYTLPTTPLSPGFYLLRIESDGVVQTIKVIKSE